MMVKENVKGPAVLIAYESVIKTFIPIKKLDLDKDIIQNCIEIGFYKFIIIIPPEINRGLIKDSILNSKFYDINELEFEFIEAENFVFEGEYPTTIEPVFSNGTVNLGDAVFIGPNVYIGKNCMIGDFSEISYSLLLGNNIIGNKVRIQNSIIREDVEISENQIIKGGLLYTEKEENS